MLVKELINILFILITALFDKYSQPELTSQINYSSPVRI